MNLNLRQNRSDKALQGFISDFRSDAFRRIGKPRFAAPENPSPAARIFGAVEVIQEARARQAAAEYAQERAELANKEKSDLLVNMSHEIRTPMSAIIGLAHVLLTTKLDDRQKQCINVLQNSAEALLAMIGNMLDIDKRESGSVRPEQSSFSMALLLEQIIGLMSVRAQEKGICLVLNDNTDSCGKFIGDSSGIRQIALNLIGNAIKFTASGKVTVSFASGKEENGKRKVSVSVADTGIGISPDKIDVIFDRFVQADSSIAPQYGGNGLGLSLSKALAENMGGVLAVSSVPGKGSVFVLTLQLPVEVAYGEQELPEEFYLSKYGCRCQRAA